ncbi:hypothetical protein [Pedobacter nyackensis]|uniref:PD-(D/E)XK nuclease superfamily protein n=1 Tax=Pedobacter nyackensis TaxID=475255 RepID=A0A1W2A0R4_9SPHI|nr:hypothetical protein [Pedobacter nyackensis]SMC54011.1 hypothetical protein SAMN04488101_101207 [Pedobacter nyackensis]
MEWNVTKLSAVRQCHRKFYFGYEASNFHFTYPFRRKAFELSKMQSLKMWQGSLVDFAITSMIIPVYKRKKKPEYAQVANGLVELAKRQFDFSKNRYYHLPELSRTEVGNDFLILDIHENGVDFLQDDVDQVYDTIHRIVLAFPDYPSPDSDKSMDEYLSSARYLRADVRYFEFDFDGVIIKPQIDLVRHNGKMADIIDWKVSDQDNADYSRQLILEGIVSYHYLKNWYQEKGWTPLPQMKDFSVYEINLLTGVVKAHPFTVENTAIALDDVYALREEQDILSQNKKWDEVDLEKDYQSTDKTETCMMCKFKLLCKHLVLNNFSYDEDKYSKLVQVKQLA